MESTTMVAEIQGIKLTGTPAQIAEVIRLAGLVQEQIRAVPVIPEMGPWKINLWPQDWSDRQDYSGPVLIPKYGTGVIFTKN